MINGVMSFAEASYIYNLKDSTLRKAIGVKLQENVDCSKSGKTWLVTRIAMEREYGKEYRDMNLETKKVAIDKLMEFTNSNWAINDKKDSVSLYNPTRAEEEYYKVFFGSERSNKDIFFFEKLDDILHVLLKELRVRKIALENLFQDSEVQYLYKFFKKMQYEEKKLLSADISTTSSEIKAVSIIQDLEKWNYILEDGAYIEKYTENHLLKDLDFTGKSLSKDELNNLIYENRDAEDKEMYIYK